MTLSGLQGTVLFNKSDFRNDVGWSVSFVFGHLMLEHDFSHVSWMSLQVRLKGSPLSQGSKHGSVGNTACCGEVPCGTGSGYCVQLVG